MLVIHKICEEGDVKVISPPGRMKKMKIARGLNDMIFYAEKVKSSDDCVRCITMCESKESQTRIFDVYEKPGDWLISYYVIPSYKNDLNK